MPVLAQRTDISCSPADWSELHLLECILDHDERAWTEALRRFRPLIYRCITKVVFKFGPSMTNADLDEIFAEVLMNLLRDNMRKLRMYDPNRGTKLSSWIGMITLNTTYDFLRSIGRRPMLDRFDGAVDVQEEHDRTPLDSLLEKERWTALNDLISVFSDKDRTFLQLYYAQGLDAEVVASRMSISLKTVYSKKHKIRAHLRRCVEGLRANNADNAIADLALAA